MALDPYALCPCGNGQKIKFCCSADIVHDLDKVLRSIEGEQRAAALDQLNRLLIARPDNPALLAVKVSVLMSLQDFDAAEKTNSHFLLVDPKNPNALAQAAILTGLKGNVRQAVERLQKSLEESGGRLSPQVHNVLRAVGEILLAHHEFLGAYQHLMLYSGVSSPDNEHAQRAFAKLRMADQVSLLLRQERYLDQAPEGAPWKARFDEAYALAQKACWLKSCEQFIALAERVPNEAKIIRNIAILRGYLGDSSGAVLWWHKYASLEAVPFEERVEAEALAQMIDSNLPLKEIDVVRMETVVNDLDRAMEKLLADKRLVAENREAYVNDLEEDEVPPKAVFSLLDRPMPATGAGLTLDGMPLTMGTLLVYGRETDRPARVLLATDRKSLEAGRSAIADLLGDLAGATTEEVIGGMPIESTDLRLPMYPPRDTTREQIVALRQEGVKRIHYEIWPRTPNRFLDYRTPEEVAGNSAYRIRLLAAILQMEEGSNEPVIDFNQLRAKLGLPTLEPIDPVDIDIQRLPAWRMPRLMVEKLSDEKLVAAFQRAIYYLDSAMLGRFGDAILSRPGAHDRMPLGDVLDLLVRFTANPEDAVRYAVRAQEYARSQRQSPAPYMIAELQARLSMGDFPGAERVVQVLSARHAKEPGVGQAIMQILSQHGLVTPDGRPRVPAPAAAGEPVAAAAAPSGIWTPGEASPAPAEKKSGLWLPE